MRKSGAVLEPRQLTRPRFVDHLRQPFDSEPLLLRRQYAEQQRFLGRHPYLDADTIVAMHTIGRRCDSASTIGTMDATYRHFQECSRCVGELEEFRRKSRDRA